MGLKIISKLNKNCYIDTLPGDPLIPERPGGPVGPWRPGKPESPFGPGSPKQYTLMSRKNKTVQ